MIFTYLIIAATVVVSMMCFNNYDLFEKLKHYPYQEARRGEYYRWLSSGFVHANQMHLIINMLSLYFFGGVVEDGFEELFPVYGRFIYVLFYLLAIVAASAATFYKHRNNSGFASIGASGAVSAVVFAAILFYPTGDIYLYYAIPIKSFIYGAGYLWYSSWAANNSRDNIDHSAHFYGAVFGFLFPILLEPALVLNFIGQLAEWFGSLGS